MVQDLCGASCCEEPDLSHSGTPGSIWSRKSDGGGQHTAIQVWSLTQFYFALGFYNQRICVKKFFLQTHDQGLCQLFLWDVLSDTNAPSSHTRRQVLLCSLGFIKRQLKIQKVKSTANAPNKIKTNHHEASCTTHRNLSHP